MVEFTMQKLATKGLHNLTWEHRGINVENKQRKTVYRSRENDHAITSCFFGDLNCTWL